MKELLRLSAFLSILPTLAPGAPISVDAFGDSFEVYHFRVASGPNSAGFSQNDSLTFGLINVVPNGYGENAGVPVFDEDGNSVPATTAIATQNGETQELQFEGDLSVPNLYSGGIAYDSALTGSWRIDLTNGTDTLTVNTPEVGDVRLPTRVSGVKLLTSGDPSAPTFTWTNTDADADAVRLTVFDPLKRDFVGQAQQVYSSPNFRNGESSFTIPAGVLEEGALYSVQLETRIERTSGVGPSGQSLAGSNLSVNRTWFDFTTGDVGIVDGIYLPEVSFDENEAPVFNFDNLVTAGLVEYYDPLVAIGYDYAIGLEGPNFASLILPEIGDSFFDLLLPQGSGFDFVARLAAGEEYFFSAGGVSAFRILGIETSAGLDPSDPTAFVTGLSFVSDGRFTGTMRPISEFVAPVPLPSSLAVMIGALGLLGVSVRKRKHPAQRI